MNHIRIPSLNNQDSMESKAVFFRGSIEHGVTQSKKLSSFRHLKVSWYRLVDRMGSDQIANL